MQQHVRVGSLTFEKLFHLIYSASWTIEFVSEQLVGRAGGIAKTAMHALAQNRIHCYGVFLLQNLWIQSSLHAKAPDTCAQD